MDAPAPLEWHPAYRDKTWLLDWLDGETGYPFDVILLPVPQRPAFHFDFDAPPMVSLAFVTRTMRRQRCAGPAPYVGRPFRYEWWAGVDDLGRAVAGESRIQYAPALDGA